MKSWFFYFTILFLIVTVVTPNLILSAPAPTSRVVNHNTKQCGHFMPGDEFWWCDLPEDWLEGDHCPSGYEEIGRIKGVNCQESEWSKQMKDEHPAPLQNQHSMDNAPVANRNKGFSCSSF